MSKTPTRKINDDPKYAPSFTGETVDAGKPLEKWENAFWKDTHIPHSIEIANLNWEKYNRYPYLSKFKKAEPHVAYYIANPKTWRTWDKMLMTEENSKSESIINILTDLAMKGIIPPFLAEKYSKTSVDSLPRVMIELYKKTIPDQKCIHDQLKYIFSHPMYFLCLLEYVSLPYFIINTAREPKWWHLKSNPKKELEEKFGIDLIQKRKNFETHIKKLYESKERVESKLYGQYQRLHPIKRHMIIDQAILHAPQCGKPIILLRGQSNNEPWVGKKIGDHVVSTSIMSTTYSSKMAIAFSTLGLIFAFHVPSHVPWLFCNEQQSEILLPSGLDMEWVSSEIVENTIVYHIKIHGFAKSARRINYDGNQMDILEKLHDPMSNIVYRGGSLSDEFKETPQSNYFKNQRQNRHIVTFHIPGHAPKSFPIVDNYSENQIIWGIQQILARLWDGASNETMENTTFKIIMNFNISLLPVKQDDVDVILIPPDKYAWMKKMTAVPMDEFEKKSKIMELEPGKHYTIMDKFYKDYRMHAHVAMYRTNEKFHIVTTLRGKFKYLLHKDIPMKDSSSLHIELEHLPSSKSFHARSPSSNDDSSAKRAKMESITPSGPHDPMLDNSDDYKENASSAKRAKKLNKLFYYIYFIE